MLVLLVYLVKADFFTSLNGQALILLCHSVNVGLMKRVMLLVTYSLTSLNARALVFSSHTVKAFVVSG